MGSSVRQLVHGDDWYHEETEYDEGDEDVDQFVDARAAVVGDVGITGLLLRFWGSEVFLPTV